MVNIRDYLKLVESEEKCSACKGTGKCFGKKCTKCKGTGQKTCKKVSESEEADNDYGDKSKSKSKGPYGKNTDAMSLQGRANIKQRVSNARYGDNPLEEDEMSEDRQNMLDTLHDILKADGADDADIIGGMTFTPKEKQQVAGRLGVSAKEVDTLVSSLIASLQSDNKKNMLQEFGETPNERFSYEADGLGSITLRDAETGENKFLQGSEATDLADRIDHAEDNPMELQKILKQSFLNESLEDLREFDDEEDSFDSEMKSKSGTYNMPWRLNGNRGFMTVYFSEKGGRPDLRIINVQNSEGDDMEMDMREKSLLLVQAKDFIHKEFL